MMFEDLLNEIHEKGIEISVINGKLNYTGPDQYITDEFLRRLKENKGKLIKHFWPLKNSNLAPLNPEGSKRPLVLVHGERGNYFFKDFLDKDQPFYGFLHLGSDGEPVKYRTVEDFADGYIRQLHAMVPKGPIFLGGFSFGGIIAFEMACKLKKLGCEVGMLILVDCINPHYKREFVKQVKLFPKLKSYLSRPDYEHTKKKFKLFIAQICVLLGITVPLSLRSNYILTNYGRAYSRYYPEKYNGNILLFRAKTNDCVDYSLGWNQSVNGKVEVFDFEGDHMSIIKESENARLFTSKIIQKMVEVGENYVA